MTGQRDPLRRFRDSSLNALMLQAAAEIRSCREVIIEAGPDMADDLQAYREGLDSLEKAIGQAAMLHLVQWIDLPPEPSRAPGRQAAPKPERHLQVVGGAR